MPAWLAVRRQDCKKRSAESALVTLPARPLLRVSTRFTCWGSGLLNEKGLGRLTSLLNFLCSVKWPCLRIIFNFTRMFLFFDIVHGLSDHFPFLLGFPDFLAFVLPLAVLD